MRAIQFTKCVRRKVIDMVCPAFTVADMKSVRADLEVLLASDPRLFQENKNSMCQRGDAVLRVYRGGRIWPSQSVGEVGGSVIRETLIDSDRVPRIFDSRRLKKFPTIKINGWVSSLDYCFTGTSYYHFFVDSLPRLWFARHPAFEGRSLKILTTAPKNDEWDFVRGLLFPEIEVKRVSAYVRVRCESYAHLPYLSKDRSGYSPFDTNTSAGFIPNEYLSYFRQKMYDYAGVSGEGKKERIYLLRGQGARRQVKNEIEVVRKLQALGFRAVDCGRLTLKEQIRVFSGAEAVVGMHGAAFTNLLFVEPGSAAVVEIFPCEKERWHYYSLHAKTLGLRYSSLNLGGSSIHDCGIVPITDLLARLQEVGLLNA